jgi:hypothetical protein
VKKKKAKKRGWPLGFAPPGPRTRALAKKKRRGPTTAVVGHSIELRRREEDYDL